VIKYCIVSAALLFNFSIVNAQVKKAAATAVKPNPHLKVYEQAMQSGDAFMAIVALNYYISEAGSSNVYTDTLAMLYLQQGDYRQAYYWADKRLQQTSGNIALQEIKGVSLDKMGRPKEAIDIFEKLYAVTKSPYHAYRLMEMQYSMKRLAECLATAISAEKLEYKPEYTMVYNIGQQTGRTYLQAGVYNIHALALYDLDKKADAKIYFEKALALDSNFMLARQNLETLNQTTVIPAKGLPQVNEVHAPPANKQN
jgi:tetratricopeptide (TPR) repeat protein